MPITRSFIMESHTHMPLSISYGLAAELFPYESPRTQEVAAMYLANMIYRTIDQPNIPAHIEDDQIEDWFLARTAMHTIISMG